MSSQPDARAPSRAKSEPESQANSQANSPANSEAKPRYNCLNCPGYCCSHARIAVSDFDIARLARHFDLPFAQAKERFTYRYRTREVDEQILRHQKDHIYASVCRFFDTDERRCTVYEARPNVCRRYPYGKVCGYYDFLKFEREHQGDETFIPSA